MWGWGGGGGGVAGPEGVDVEVEVGVRHAVAGLELGDYGFWGEGALVGGGDEEADWFEGLGLEFEEGGGELLGFGDAEEDEAGDVVCDGGDEVVF